MSAEIPELTNFFRRQNFLRRFEKGHLICSQEEQFDYVFMIHSGMVKMYDIDRNGDERTIAIFAGRSIFPLVWLLRDAPKEHLYYYEAYSDAICYVARQEEVRFFTRAHPHVLLGVADALAKAYINLAARVTNLERSHVRERMEFVLYMLATRLGTFEGTVAEISAIVTQEDISRMAGVTRESVSLEMNHAKERELMWKHGHSTFIDIS